MSFFFEGYGDHRHLHVLTHSFPTRRSSDLPDHSLKPILFDLLEAGRTSGATLTESFAMLPTAAVSGFYFGHPDASYFGVARVGEDQLADYAERRGVDIETARRWLRPNLD